jgi:CheY-like chemotaxis protein
MRTVLLVDDDIDLLRSVAGLLRSRGYDVLEHSDPREALVCASLNRELAFVLTDIDMPGMDGISLMNELRRIRPILQTVLMTGEPERWKTAGSERRYHLRKPFTSDELFRAIEHHAT